MSFLTLLSFPVEVGSQYTEDLSPPPSPKAVPQDPPSGSPPEATVEVVDVDYAPSGGVVSCSAIHTERGRVVDSPSGARMAPRGGKSTLRPQAASVPLGTPGKVGPMSCLMKCATRLDPLLTVPGLLPEPERELLSEC